MSAAEAVAQDALGLYHWEAVPKRLVINPAAPVPYRAWLSLPVVGHVDGALELPWAGNDVLDLGGATFRSLLDGSAGLDADEIPLDVPAVIDGLGRVGEVRVTSRVNLLSAGVRTAAGLFSLNLDQRLDAIASIGPTPVQGLYFGEGFVLDRGVEAAGIGYDATARISLALGFQRAVENTPWRVGGALKLTRTQAHYRLLDIGTAVARDPDGGAVVTFNGRQQLAGWSDLFEGRDDGPELAPRRLFSGGNYGVGVDLGVHYAPNERLALSASVVDLGVQRLSDRVGEYGFVNDLRVGQSEPLAQRESVSLQDGIDEAGDISKDGRDSLTNRDPYSRPLPGAVYLGGEYRFRDDHSVGIVTRGTLRDGRLQSATALSLNLRPSRFVEAHTSLSYSSVGGVGLGFGASLQLAVVQVYLGSDNVVALVNPLGGRRFSAVAGLNFLLPEKPDTRGLGTLRQRRKAGGKEPKCYRF